MIAVKPTVPSGARTLSDFEADAEILHPEVFATKHGDGFLLLQGDRSILRKNTRPLTTHLVEDAPSIDNATPQLDFLVYALKRRPDSRFPDFVSIGRTDNNDVMIDDRSISKFHAFVRMGHGSLCIQDADSTNGTFLNDERVPDRTGDAVPLSIGARVRFGEIELTYLPAANLRDLVLRLRRANRQ
jgi:hypothetical protein